MPTAAITPEAGTSSALSHPTDVAPTATRQRYGVPGATGGTRYPACA